MKNLFSAWLISRALCLACIAAALGGSMANADDPKTPATKPAEIAIQGKCVFMGKTSNWSAKLTPKGDNTYDAVYKATWGGKPLDYTGTVKGDLKTTISGTGKAVAGGNANGTFEFSGKYDEKGVAKCNYKEVGGGRSGTMTVDPAEVT